MFRPRIKTVYPPFPQGEGVIRIGGDFGMAGEIRDDEAGHVWHLLRLLDGSRTMDQLAAAMRAFDPALERDDVDAAVDTLIEAGYLEDAAVPPPAGVFQPDELERYRRNIEFFSYFNQPRLTAYDAQARLKQARVTVLGLGGLGCHVALSLAAAGIGDLLLVDHDTVEPHNLNRQVLYTDRDLGALKAVAAATRLREVNPFIAVTGRTLQVGSVDDARNCLHDRDILICAADRPRIRLYDWLNAAALAERVAWVRGANDGLTVNLFLHVPYETACFECEQMHARALFPWYGDFMRYAIETLGDQTVNPCTSPVAGLIGNLVALEVVKYLTGVAPPVIHNRKLCVDLQQMETVFIEGVRQPRCPLCGEGAAVLQPAGREASHAD